MNPPNDQEKLIRADCGQFPLWFIILVSKIKLVTNLIKLERETMTIVQQG